MCNTNVEEVKLSLKVMIDNQENKVLFAEADSDFADVLLSFLTLPLGKIVRLMNNHYGDEAPVIGSITNMYNRLADLDSANFWTEGGKQMLLDPASSFGDECSNLKINVDDAKPAMKYYRCGNRDCIRKRSPLITLYHGMLKCDCGKYMNKPMDVKGLGNQDDGDDGGVFMKKGLSFLITDDFRMMPVVSGSILQTLIDLGVTIPDGAELRIVPLGLNDIMDLLRASLLSTTPLTDIIFHCKKYYAITHLRIADLLRHVMAGDLPIYMMPGDLLYHMRASSSKNLILKARLCDSKNRLLWFEAGGDFVDFFFSLLVIPLGGVEWLVDGDTGLRSIDNLYKSIRDCIDDTCFKVPDMKPRLMKPRLPPNCRSKNMFYLDEEVNPRVCYSESLTTTGESSIIAETSSWMRFKDPKGGESYVKSSATFIVSDYLTVYRDCKDVRKKIKISSLHEERDQFIIVDEVLNILKSSLTSGFALNDWLGYDKKLKY